jgi:hypothetical protein
MYYYIYDNESEQKSRKRKNMQISSKKVNGSHSAIDLIVVVQVIQLDVKSNKYVIELYEILVIEDRDECEPMFTVKKCYDNLENYANELKAVLIKQKKEALSEIIKLITLIHNIVDYEDNLLESYHPFVLSTEQNKELQVLQENHGKFEKLEGIACLVSKTYYEYVTKK